MRSWSQDRNDASLAAGAVRARLPLGLGIFAAHTGWRLLTRARFAEPACAHPH